jgi:hypothetical protein
MEKTNYPIILSFDVGIINLAYCILTKKEFINKNNEKYIDWFIIDWNIINLMDNEHKCCNCNKKALYTNIENNINKYYCGIHSKKIKECIFDDCFIKCNEKNCNKCNKKSVFKTINNEYYCSVHAKQTFNSFKTKKIKKNTSSYDDIVYKLVNELEQRNTLLNVDYVVIENQPSFKNPKMKSIAMVLYNYYLIRGIIDKQKTNSNIKQIKFMSPSNKLKLASEEDTNKINKTNKYKLTKQLGIKYCLENILHLTDWKQYFESHKKKDDLADSFLQGLYLMNTIKIE